MSSSNKYGISQLSGGIYEGVLVMLSYTANNTPGGVGDLKGMFLSFPFLSTMLCILLIRSKDRLVLLFLASSKKSRAS